MPSFLYEDLTQRMEKILEPRYRTMHFENGDLIPTMVDLDPGMKEIAYDKINEFGDADLVSDAATNIPVVDISLDEDRYPIYMVAAGFPLSLQEERAYNANHYHASSLNRFERRMAVARKAIAQRTNQFTALSVPNINFPGFLTNSLVSTDNSAFNLYTSTYQQCLDFFVDIIESLTDNFVTDYPTDMLVPKDVHHRMVSLENGLGTVNLMERLEQLYPDLMITKTKELEAALIDSSGITRPGAGKDRIMLYPKEPDILNRHIEEQVAQLAPEEYIRTDGLRRIYPMFSCITPAIFDYPTDCRYIDIPVKA
ncbi:MAG: DUF2184 domain-containing protein [Symploca sp. SIO2C1]|nr:DUF2184 domain-containing protein [Symploca sp. SIO2C1]